MKLKVEEWMFNFASGVVHAALTRPRGADGTVGSGKDSASPAVEGF